MRIVSSLLAVLAGCVPVAGARRHDSTIAALRRDETRTPLRADDPSITSANELDRGALVQAVIARNPDAAAARAAWRAAIAKYPAAVGLDDPMVTYEVAPLSVASDEARFGQRVSLSQKLPWPGKRRRAGEAALAEADAAQADYAATQVELGAAAVELFDDYYLNARALEVNAHHRQILESLEKSAIAQYTVGHASQQDALAAGEEIIDLRRDRLMLETERKIIVARINGLLHRDASAELPPPPATLASTAEPTAPDINPKQAAARAHVRAASAGVDAARSGFYPDLELMASYDSMWDMPEHRWMIGAAIEIPLQRAKRRAAVEEARAEQARAEAELAGVEDTVGVAIKSATSEVDEARQVITLYQDELLPTARQRVDAALAGYVSGANDFQTVMMAEHALRAAELKLEEARALLDRKQAALDRARGVAP